MAWQCIAGGANGLIFYSWFDLWKMDRRTAAPGSKLQREPFEKRWKDIKTMAAEIRRFFPVLLSEQPGVVPENAQAPDGVAWRVFGKDGATWLLVVNSEPRPANAAFTFPKPLGSVEARLGPGDGVHSDGVSLRIALQPLDILFLRCTPR